MAIPGFCQNPSSKGRRLIEENLIVVFPSTNSTQGLFHRASLSLVSSYCVRSSLDREPGVPAIDAGLGFPLVHPAE